MLRTALAGSDIQLLSEGGACLMASATLLVADLHLGKARSFRRLGVPVPEATTAESLQRLSQAVQACAARRVVFLGDLLHSAHARHDSIDRAFSDWRARHAALELQLVRGNHDGHAGDPPAHWGVQVCDEPLMDDGFALCHHPQPVDNAYVLAGHWHPCISLGGRAGERLRLPCFWFGDPQRHAVGVLPAFGAFTGMHPVQRRAGDRVVVIAGRELRELGDTARRERPTAAAVAPGAPAAG